jgi:hypothetical protein
MARKTASATRPSRFALGIEGSSPLFRTSIKSVGKTSDSGDFLSGC